MVENQEFENWIFLTKKEIEQKEKSAKQSGIYFVFLAIASIALIPIYAAIIPATALLAITILISIFKSRTRIDLLKERINTYEILKRIQQHINTLDERLNKL